MDKHREFWIDTDELGDNGGKVEVFTNPVKYRPDTYIHVVEFKALKELLNINEGLSEKIAMGLYQNKQLQDLLRQSGHHWTQDLERSYMIQRDLEIAIEALKAYRGIGSNQMQDVGKEPITANVALEKLAKYEKE